MKVTFLLLFLWATISHAQITGKITTTTGEELPYVNVILYKSVDTSIVSGTFSDNNGLFSLNMPSDGSYTVGLRSLGFQSFYSKPIEILVNQKNQNMGELTMREASNELNELVVTSKKDFIQQTSTDKVINVQNSIMTKGSSTLQILERLPGVIIDKRNNNLSLNGQNGVVILINGRTTPLSSSEILTMLNSMNGDNIHKIELITSPTAEYDAQGNALINIVLKRNDKNGTNLNLSTSAGYGYREKAATTLNFTHFHNKTNYFMAYSFLHDVGKSSWQAKAFVDIPAAGGYYYSDFYSGMYQNNNAHNLSTGFDHQLNSKTQYGANLNFIYANTNPSVKNDALYDFKTSDLFYMKSISTADNIWKICFHRLF
jgi:iron complex outermembrane recepter protein